MTLSLLSLKANRKKDVVMVITTSLLH